MNKLTYIFIFLVMFSCVTDSHSPFSKTEKAEISAECVSANDSAVSFLHLYYQSKDSTYLDSSLYMFERAIICDSNYFLAYANSFSVLCLKKKYEEAIKSIDKAIKLSNNDPETILIKGYLYEKLFGLDSAKRIYKQVELEYKRRITLYPDSIKLICDQLFFMAIIGDKENAIKKLDRYKTKYPESSLFEEYAEAIKFFDKEKFLKDLP